MSERSRRIVGAGIVLAVLVIGDVRAGAAPPGEVASVWLVQMDDPTVVQYEGGVPGVAPTARSRPRGQRNDVAEGAYRAVLEQRHHQTARHVGATPMNDYTDVVNGFSAQLTPSQAASIRQAPGVVSVTRSRLVHRSTSDSPQLLGLSAPGGVWSRVGGPGAAGEDIVIGVIDTGIWPEHPSFSDQSDLADRPGRAGDARRTYAKPEGWRGRCIQGEDFDRSDCNNKVIGARFYIDGLRAQYGGEVESEYVSPRDADGHGTHVAATAGGNSGVSAAIHGQPLGLVSGVAPRARIAVYKALWNSGLGIGADVDIVKAIDDAVRDGVDVLNLSLGQEPGFASATDPVSIALLRATVAGVTVVQAAGNDGPGPSTLGNNAPWATTVAAGTQARTFTADVVLGNGAGSFRGESGGGNLPALPLTLGESSGAGDPDAARHCLAGSLRPAAVRGKVVVCTRGRSYLHEMVTEVRRAGGSGAIIRNASPDDDLWEPIDIQLPETYSLPAVRVSHRSGATIAKYVARRGARATAAITPISATAIAPQRVADFSSRGPNLASGDLLTPDVVAPGTGVLAANSSSGVASYGGQPFAIVNGTSMAAPHAAGVAALLRQRHPSWSPAMVKSAMMTTAAGNLSEQDGSGPAGPFAEGAGFLQPNMADTPGLVYDVSDREYLAVACGLDAALCRRTTPLPTSALNLPSIALGRMIGTTSVVRRVTNVGATTATYRATVSGLAGVKARVSPSVLTLRPGETKAFTVTLDPAAAAKDEYTSGALAWTSGATVVRSPIVVSPQCANLPVQLDGTGTAGATTLTTVTGCAGMLESQTHGLVPDAPIAGTVADNPADDINAALDTGLGLTLHTVTVEPGTRHLRLALRSSEVSDPGDDIDLRLFRSDDDELEWGESVAASLGAASDELIDVTEPEPGRYVVVVHGYETVGPSSDYTLHSWLVGPALGNLSAAPPSQQIRDGGTATVGLSWTGLAPGTEYLGALSFALRQAGTISDAGTTLISVTT